MPPRKKRPRTPERVLLADIHASKSYLCGGAVASRGRVPKPNLPKLDVSDSEAQRLVTASPLRGLRPDQPGVSSKSWQELAAVSTQLPDITWLGVVVEQWNFCGSGPRCVDYACLHMPGHTALSDRGHRMRLGEKVLKYGGIDLCVRTLSVFAQEEQVGYHGVMDIFDKSRSMQDMEHYLPKFTWFLKPSHWNAWIAPRFEAERKITRQQVLNSLLLKAMLMITSDTDTKVVQQLGQLVHVFRELGAQMAPSSDLALGWFCSGSSWEELWGSDDFVAAGARLWFLLHLPFSREARGDRSQAEFVMECDDVEDEIQELLGEDEDFTFRGLVERCLTLRAFNDDGLRFLCSRVGLPFQAERPAAPYHQQARMLEALGVVSRQLSVDISALRRM